MVAVQVVIASVVVALCVCTDSAFCSELQPACNTCSLIHCEHTRQRNTCVRKSWRSACIAENYIRRATTVCRRLGDVIVVALWPNG